MKRILAGMLTAGLMGGLAGCAAGQSYGESPFATAASNEAVKDTPTPSNAESGRMLVWNAYLEVEVSDVSTAVEKAAVIAERFKGYVDQRSDNGEASASIRLKIPAASFKEAVEAAQAIGKVTQTRVVGEDVTDQVVDVQARLKTKIELRDRLRQLLQRTTEIKDAIAIETELARVQGEIEAMEGRLKLLKSQVDYSTISVTFGREKIFGPLGLVFQGIFWGIKKLFVIQE